VDSVQTGEAPPGTVHEIDSFELSRVLTTAPHFLGIGERWPWGGCSAWPCPGGAHHRRRVADPHRLGTKLTPGVEQAVAPAAERVTEQAP